MSTVMEPSALITADAHVGENTDLRDRLPERFRGQMPLLIDTPRGDHDMEVDGKVVERGSGKELSSRDRELEFRSDPSRGTDLDIRMRDMARERVDAQVLFPNVALNCGGGQATREYAKVFARTYNAYVDEVFQPESQRFKPAAMIPTDDIEDGLAEAQQCIDDSTGNLRVELNRNRQVTRGVFAYRTRVEQAKELELPGSLRCGVCSKFQRDEVSR